ncbi:MAG TPA: hypothetical protein VIJ23_01745 [Mycobacterium sp.]
MTTRCGVLGALGVAVREASFEDGPGGGVQRHRLRAVTQPDGASAGVDVVQPDHPDLDAGRAVQQRQDTQERFVRVDGGIRSPSVKQLSLLVESQRGAGEAPRC